MMAKRRRTNRQFRVEILEDRLAPAAMGLPWPDPQHLTLSFVPDGTAQGTLTSDLFKSMRASTGLADADWQLVILKAVQTWAAKVDVNVSLVADGGQAIGAPGAPQKDSRFGDIRISSIPLTNALAIGGGFDPIAGTRAGDITFNSQVLFSTNGSTPFDLYTVALHEAGHIFGLHDNIDPNTVMYSTYQGARPGLSAGDVIEAQANYGPKPGDGFEGSLGNETTATATPIANVLTDLSNYSKPNVLVKASLNISTDVDVYAFTPDTSGPMTVQFHTSDVSLLKAKLTVTNAQGQTIGTASASDPRKGDLAVSIPNASTKVKYYIKVASNSADAFGVGAYMLRATHDTITGTGSKATSTASNLGWGTSSLSINNLMLTGTTGNDSFSTALVLVKPTQQMGTVSYFTKQTLSTFSPVDYNTFVTPTGNPSYVITAAVWGSDASMVDARITLYDASLNAVASTVLVHEGAGYVVQFAGALPGTRYYTKVEPFAPMIGDQIVTGDYNLTILQSQSATNLVKIQEGDLTPPTTSTTAGSTFRSTTGTELTANVDQLFHFVLSAKNATNVTDTRLTMFVNDELGRLVTSLPVLVNQVQSLSIQLAKGKYTISFQSQTLLDGLASPISYSLQGAPSTDPNVPYTSDPLLYPINGTTPPPTSSPTSPMYSISTVLFA